MKRFAILIVVLALVAGTAVAQVALPRPSPKASVTQTVGLTDVSIVYSRPGVKGRTIWGDLVPYDKVWRTGANEATIITFSRDVKVDGQPLKAGSYSIHSIPTAGEWTLIFNSEANPNKAWSYDETKDVLRIKVQPQSHGFAERLTFVFLDVDDAKATAALMWEKLTVPFTIEVDTDAHVMSQAKAALEDWRPAFQAASYAWEHGHKDDAARWIDQSIASRESYSNLTLKAKMLADGGKAKDAIATAEKAVKIGKDAKANTEATEKLIADWKAAGGKKRN